jgi:hypothetical protein
MFGQSAGAGPHKTVDFIHGDPLTFTPRRQYPGVSANIVSKNPAGFPPGCFEPAIVSSQIVASLWT